MTADLPALVQRAKGRDREALAEFYRQTVTPVYRYLAARLRTVEETEELTQEVFLAALNALHRLRAEDDAGVLAWLFQIARHKLADHLRARYRRPVSPLRGHGADGEISPEAPDPGPQELAETTEEREALRRALEELTPEQREVVLCKYVLELGNQQTARIVGKNTNAVNQLHHRALAALHRLLTKKQLPLSKTT